MLFELATFLTMTWFLLFLFCDLSEEQDEEELEKIAQQEQKLFPFETLVAATRDFHLTHKLGEGGFGPVYRVRLYSAVIWIPKVVYALNSVWFLRKFKM